MVECDGSKVCLQATFSTPHSALAPRLQTSIKFQYNSMGINLVFFIIVVKVTKVT